MKRERMTFSVCSAAVLLGAVIGFACVMCLAEAFSVQCDPRYLVAACCITAGAAVASMSVRRSWIPGMIAAIGYVAILIWRSDMIAEGFRTLLYKVTYEYSLCFEGAVPIGEPEGQAVWFLGVIAAPLTWLGVWTVCREGHTAIIALACAPIFVLCLLVVNLAPVFWLLLLTAALLLLVMAGHVRAYSAHNGSRLIWWLVLPVAVLFFALLTLSPVAEYVRSDWSANLQSIAEGNYDFSHLRKKASSMISARWMGDPEKEDLSKVGPQAKTGVYVLQYKSDVPIRYLRGSSLGYYEDNTWHKVELPVSWTVEQVQLVRPSSETKTVMIETGAAKPLFYTAYDPAAVPENGAAVNDSRFENPERVRGYAVRFSESGTPQISPEYEAFVYDAYLQIPDPLRDSLYQYLQDQGLMNAAPSAIADAVRTGAVYDLNTPAVPDGEDFTLHFLTQSRRGYCVHFATSTVLLLRSAGIPARYVTGYAVDGEAGTWIEVTEDDAHAWVEYYTDGVGWRPLDPTPGAQNSGGEVSVPPDEEPPAEQPPKEETPRPVAPDVSSKQDDAQPETGHGWGLIPILAAALVLLRRPAILYCRHVQNGKGHPNRRTLHKFTRLVRLYRAQKEPVPEQWICLAEKAKFSQHRISEEELASLSEQIALLTAELKKRSFLKRLWYRFGPVLY